MSPATERSGSERAIEALYRARYRRFLRVALAILHDREAARDAVQETFARALRAHAQFRGEGSLEAWVWRTLTNLCIDARRRAGRDDCPAGAEPARNGHSADWPDVRAAIAELPERQRLALFLRYYADLDDDAIADALGVERGTVAASLHAARHAVRSKLEEVR